MANLSKQDEEGRNPGHTDPAMTGRSDVAPGSTEGGGQRVIDDQGGGTGLPTEALRSPVRTPIGGPSAAPTGEADSYARSAGEAAED